MRNVEVVEFPRFYLGKYRDVVGVWKNRAKIGGVKPRIHENGRRPVLKDKPGMAKVGDPSFRARFHVHFPWVFSRLFSLLARTLSRMAMAMGSTQPDSAGVSRLAAGASRTQSSRDDAQAGKPPNPTCMASAKSVKQPAMCNAGHLHDALASEGR
jgi:hypothetical protein